VNAILTETNKVVNGRKVWYANGTPGELKGAKPGDTVVQDGQVYAIGWDGRLWLVKVQ
jgi:hypothetical protein